MPSKLWVRHKFRSFVFSFAHKNYFFYEFRQICIEDCYKLNILKNKIRVNTIVDIGANQGLFILAARKKFPKAVIHAYEPNPQLDLILRNNAFVCKARVYMEAVSDEDGFMRLEFGESDLQTRAIRSDKGDIPSTSFAKVIERVNGTIDVLKMDCEGGEWLLLELPDLFINILSITMEYHLWAKKDMTLKMLEKKIAKLGFDIIHVNAITDTFGLIVACKSN